LLSKTCLNQLKGLYMKNVLMMFVAIMFMVSVGCSSSKTADQSIDEAGEKTIGQQLVDAGASLEDCRKNCERAETVQAKNECREACKYAKAMHEMAVKMNENAANMNQQQLARIRALQAQGKLPQDFPVNTQGAQGEEKTQ
jgi:preprotein translocase subunit SecF